METEQKICGNCEYFIQHYKRSRRGIYDKLGTGHCRGSRIKKGLRNRYVRISKKACEHWVPQNE